MGYFRFRRSFKILPGVRWNIGKKSSSVSLGGRGFHYTIGPAGQRTTVGLPGTGLSYTSVHRRKRADRIPDDEVTKAVEWSKAQKETFHLELPDRTPDETPATAQQLEEIHDLVHSISDADLVNLGAKQAAFLITQITREKTHFTEQKIHEYLDRNSSRSGSGCLFAILALSAGIIYIVTQLKK
jgi:hypothetical protein